MGFGAYATLAGVQRYYSREDYEKVCGTGDFDGYWGIWDEPFLQYMSRTLSETPEPFFASAFTLTSHHPFVVPERYADTLVRDVRSENADPYGEYPDRLPDLHARRIGARPARGRGTADRSDADAARPARLR